MARVLCSRATHCCSTCVFHGGTACGRETFPRSDCAAFMHNIMVQLQRKEKGKKGTPRAGKVDGRGGKEEEKDRVTHRGSEVLCARRCGHTIATTTRAGEDGDGDRDCVLGSG